MKESSAASVAAAVLSLLGAAIGTQTMYSLNSLDGRVGRIEAVMFQRGR